MDKIVDVTIAYPDGKPLGLFDILSAWRDPCAINVHYKIYDIKEVRSQNYLNKSIHPLLSWYVFCTIEKLSLLLAPLGPRGASAMDVQALF